LQAWFTASSSRTIHTWCRYPLGRSWLSRSGSPFAWNSPQPTATMNNTPASTGFSYGVQDVFRNGLYSRMSRTFTAESALKS
jgi:hypothetical protein